MELIDYLDPVKNENLFNTVKSNSIGRFTEIHSGEKGFPELTQKGIALIGIPHFNNDAKDGNTKIADTVRSHLYNLSTHDLKTGFADLGNIKQGRTPADLNAALFEITHILLSRNITPFFIGGEQKLAYQIFTAYEKQNKTVNITSVDQKPGLSVAVDGSGQDHDYLNKIILEQNNDLFNYTNIGYQSCFTTKKEIELLEELLFDYFRLGKIRSDMKEADPVMRDTDLLILSMSAIRQSDAPGNACPSPNGLYAEEACQLAKYAGLSDRLSSAGLFDLSPGRTVNEATAHLAAQIVWYFLEGVSGRKAEFPFDNTKNCKKFIINLSESDNELVFYKSSISERWWMEVPSSRIHKNLIIACSYEDYRTACNQEIPERWWRAFKKIN